ncbi:MAG: haloacid dehalogenase-like hydrolase [Erysipelotrichaceae bacterium]|nr:haloacid dehalogenase-like hydrolase [Erysipelotrichaceae bacterium]
MYDFDYTLSPMDMQAFHYIGKLGYDNVNDFWAKCNENTHKNNMDSVLSYMELMVRENPNVTRKELIKEGEYIKLFRGVEGWFSRINAYGRKHHVDVEHYIISSGIKEMIQGTKIAGEFKKIYACSYTYDRKGRVLWPSRVVNYTTKTQYLFRINKGVLDETNDFDLNRKTPASEKHIPFSNIVYFGDGLTDVPSMKVVLEQGGNTVAVYKDEEKKKDIALELQKDDRAAYVALADYSANSKIDRIIKSLIDSIETKAKLDKLR